MEFTLDIKTLGFLLVQFAMVIVIINNNRNTAKYLKEQGEEHKEWLKELQKTVNDLRVKVGL